MKSIFMALAATLLLLSCTKDPASTPIIKEDRGNLHIEFDPKWNGTPLQMGQSYQNVFGEQITPSVFKYYVSNIELVRVNGERETLPNQYYLVNHAQGKYEIELEGIEAGQYIGLSFLVGVDSLRNVSGVQEGALDPVNGMFWSWNSGYIFSKFEGNSPQSPDSTGRFYYHVGGFKSPNNAVRKVELWFPSSADGGELISPIATPEVHLHVDAYKLFHAQEEIRVSGTSVIHMPGNAAMRLANNYQKIFSVDHVH